MSAFDNFINGELFAKKRVYTIDDNGDRLYLGEAVDISGAVTYKFTLDHPPTGFFDGGNVRTCTLADVSAWVGIAPEDLERLWGADDEAKQ